MVEEINIGVAGLGRIGKVHAEIFKTKVPKARLVAVLDIDASIARGVGERLKVKWYTDYEKMLQEDSVDAVIICTPTYLHYEMIIMAAEYGKHVFCEKPMCLTVKEANEILSKISKNNIKLQIGYMRRFDDTYSRAKSYIEDGKIGEPLAYIGISRDPAPPPGWVADPKLSGGLFLDLMSHDFDMARWIIGSEVRSVYAIGEAYVFEEVKKRADLDHAIVNLEFKNKSIAVINGTRNSVYGYDIRAEVIGSKGTLFIGSNVNNLFAVGTKDTVIFNGFSWFQEKFYPAYVKEDISFVDVILNDKEPLIGCIDGLRAVEIAEACWKSVKEGKKIII